MKPAHRDIGYLALQGPGWLLLLYLIVAQAIPAFDYELGVAMGTQESAAQITAVGTAFFYGFAFGDLVVYIPLLAFGLLGHARARNWGRVMLIRAHNFVRYRISPPPLYCHRSRTDRIVQRRNDDPEDIKASAQ